MLATVASLVWFEWILTVNYSHLLTVANALQVSNHFNHPICVTKLLLWFSFFTVTTLKIYGLSDTFVFYFRLRTQWRDVCSLSN